MLSSQPNKNLTLEVEKFAEKLAELLIMQIESEQNKKIDQNKLILTKYENRNNKQSATAK